VKKSICMQERNARRDLYHSVPDFIQWNPMRKPIFKSFFDIVIQVCISKFHIDNIFKSGPWFMKVLPGGLKNLHDVGVISISHHIANRFRFRFDGSETCLFASRVHDFPRKNLKSLFLALVSGIAVFSLVGQSFDLTPSERRQPRELPCRHPQMYLSQGIQYIQALLHHQSPTTLNDGITSCESTDGQGYPKPNLIVHGVNWFHTKHPNPP